MQPITDQLLCSVLERQDVFDDCVSIYLKSCQDIMNAFLRREEVQNLYVLCQHTRTFK